MNTMIYLSVSKWEDCMADDIPLSEQSHMCQMYMKEHPELKKKRTFSDENTVRNKTMKLHQLMEQIENRNADCIVVPSLYYFFERRIDARFYITRVMIPAGIRLICIKEQLDTFSEDAIKKMYRALGGYRICQE